MTNKNVIRLIAVGDIMPRRENAEELFSLAYSILKEGDITIAQLERPISERAPVYTTSTDIKPRRLAKVLADTGFNLLTFASNHTMDGGDDGLLDTIDMLNEHNIRVIGAGKNIEEARKPAIFDCKGTKVGFLDFCSVITPGTDAGSDKPGVSPIRINTAYQVPGWQPGEAPRVLTTASAQHLRAMVDDIKKLRPMVDVLVVCQHWGLHFVTSPIADYEYEVGHAAIDAGADIIIGTHAHTLKGIEVYKGKVILHCLGNFAFDHYVSGPMSVMRGMPFDSHYRSNMGGWKVDPEYPTHAFPIDCQKSILLKCDIIDKKIQRVAFHPCWITKKGVSEPLSHTDPRNDEVFHYIEWLCEDQRLYDTKFKKEGDEIVILT